LQDHLLILCSLGSNISGVTTKLKDGAVPIFDLLLYEKIFLTSISLLFFTALFRSFRKPKIADVFIRKRTAVTVSTNKQLTVVNIALA
jgi:hypothetical protein